MSGLLSRLFPAPQRPVTKLFSAYVKSLPKMTGKTVAITGCTSGTGFVLAKLCGELGARVVMLNRPSERAEAALSALKQLHIDALLVPCDLQRFDSVRAAAAQLKALCADGIDVLCNNAGVMALPDTATPDGFDVQMQSNHLSHFLLTAELWSLLELAATRRGEARVVNHSSGARKRPAVPIAALYLGRNGGNLGGDRFPGFAKWKRYQQSKLANLLFTYALHDKVAAARPALAGKVKILCAHPGPTDTGLQAKASKASGDGFVDRILAWMAMGAMQSTEDGTLGIARACCEPAVESLNFYGPVGLGKAGPAELLPQERNPEGEELLWRESMKATGLSRFFV